MITFNDKSSTRFHISTEYNNFYKKPCYVEKFIVIQRTLYSALAVFSKKTFF